MSDYNITAVTRRKVYSGSAGVGPYAFTFPVISQTDIAVYKNNTKLTLTTNYTVSINSTNGTGSVTLVVAATGSDQITIVGSRTLQRTTDFVTAGDLAAASLNEQLDGQIIMIQQIAEENKRTLKAPVYDLEALEDGGTLNMVLPTSAQRANNVLAFDASGNPVATEEIGDYRGNWATSTLYAKRDLIKDTSNSNIYRANTEHTSSGSQPISSNADSAKWDLIVDAAAAGTSATAAAASASAAASSASAASSSASSASSSASSASTSASTATTQASNASTSAANAASSASSASTSATNAGNSATAASNSAALAAATVAGGLYSAVIDKSANYTVVLADAGDLIRVTTTSGAVTITLPQISTVADGFKVAIVKWSADSNAVTISRSGSDTINGATSASIGSQYTQTTFVADFETNQWFASTSGLGSTNVVIDAFNGTGSQTAFTLSGDPGTENNTSVYVSGVYQSKATYSQAGTTITFSTAPPSGTGNVEIVWTQPLPVGTPSDNTVTTAKIVDANVTIAKLSATGTPSASNFLRGDNTWSTVGSATGEILTSISSSKTGYLLCDGSTYTRTSYATLAAAIGTPLSPVVTLGNALSTSLSVSIQEANGLLFKSGTAASTTAAVANGIQTSTDGITWTLRTGLNLAALAQSNQQVSFGNSVYILFSGYSTAGTTLYYQTTPDGVTYTTRTITGFSLDGSESFGSIAFGGTSNRHVFTIRFTTVSACVQSNSNVRIVYTTDGVTLTTAETNTLTSSTNGYTNHDVAGYSGGFVYIAARDDNVNLIKHSVDGATWTDITSNVNSVATINGVVKAVSYVNGRFLLVTSNGQIYTSTTGATGTWSQLVAQNPIYNNKIRGNSTAYVTTNSAVSALGTPVNSVLSTDGINWLQIPNLGLGNVFIAATPSTGTKFYATTSAGVGSYYVDAYNYTTATQFVVPKLSVSANSIQSFLYTGNGVPINYLIKT